MGGNQDSETPSRRQVTTGLEARVASGDQRAHLTPPVAPSEEGDLRLRSGETAGLQVGSGNVQINNFYGDPTKFNAGAALQAVPGDQQVPESESTPGQEQAMRGESASISKENLKHGFLTAGKVAVALQFRSHGE